MKDNRFIELVNLYIDRQITDDETTELEAEMQSHPRRRAIYRQYCQMHRATTLVYESFQPHVSGQQPEAAADRATIARLDSQPRHRWVRWAYYAGGLAAAACLALLFIRLDSIRTAAPSLAAAPRSSPPAVVVASQPPAAAMLRETDGAPQSLVSLRNNNLAVEQDYTVLLAALRQEEQRAAAAGQLQPERLPSLFDDGVFESRQVLPASNQRVFRGRQTPAQPAEFTAFQFQR